MTGSSVPGDLLRWDELHLRPDGHSADEASQGHLRPGGGHLHPWNGRGVLPEDQLPEECRPLSAQPLASTYLTCEIIATFVNCTSVE